jgi:predicted nucleic acid-binding protein
MILIDTSVWIETYKDRTGKVAAAAQLAIAGRTLVFVRPIAQELLQGARNDAEWKRLDNHLATQTYLEMRSNTWVLAARIFFDLQRKAHTLRSSVDCCIAQLAIENNASLLHIDRDFDAIATIRPLKHLRLTLNKATP